MMHVHARTHTQCLMAVSNIVTLILISQVRIAHGSESMGATHALLRCGVTSSDGLSTGSALEWAEPERRGVPSRQQ